MDIGFDYRGGCRNGLDSNYFDFLGIGEGKKKVGKWRSAQAQELATNNPYANNVDDQSKLVQKHQAILDGLKNERAKAKSKKTKNSLDARIQAYEEWLDDAKYYLTQLEAEAQKATIEANQPTPSGVTLVSGGSTYNVEPAPIVTSVGGEVQLPKKQVYVQENAPSPQEDLTLSRRGDVVANEGLAQPTNGAKAQIENKDNTLLYLGIGIGAIMLIVLMRKNK